MKRTIKSKNLISLIAVLILLVSITTASAFALPNPQRMKAGIAAAITAINIAMTSATAPIQEMIDYIGDPYDYTYTYAEAFNDRPTIQIWDDYIEIDGQQYTDIWISNEAAEKFRVNAFDFRSAYNIASNSDGTFASGEGFYDGIPIYEIDNIRRSQTYSLPYPYTQGAYLYPTGNGDLRQSVSYDGSIPYINYVTSTGYYTNQISGSTSGTDVYFDCTNFRIRTPQSLGSTIPTSYWRSSPFDFDYVAGTIRQDAPLPEDTGMMIRIPSYDPQGNKYLEPFYVNNPEFDDDQPVTVDVNLDPDIYNKLDDLFDIITPIIPIINNNYGDIQFIENHESPAPVIDNLLPDTYKSEILNPIYENFQETQNIINQMGDTIVENIPKIDEICNNIDTAPYHDLDTGLDHLPTVFLPFITDLRSALGIWHYVTEWIGQISTTFTFVIGCLVGTSIMTPIYAAIAGFMCIKVYRRMTG